MHSNMVIFVHPEIATGKKKLPVGQTTNRVYSDLPPQRIAFFLVFQKGNAIR